MFFRKGSTSGNNSAMDHMDDFGDMAGAAKSYVANTPKGPSVPTPSVPGVTCPSRPDNNPYRQKHGLMVWDASEPDAPVPDPYQVPYCSKTHHNSPKK